MRFALPEPTARLDHDLRPRRFHHIQVDKASVPADASSPTATARPSSARSSGVCRFGDMPAARNRPPALAVPVGRCGIATGADQRAVFSDGVAELARFSADYQRRIRQSLSTSLRDIKSGSESLALWTLVAVCFGYGVVHTLGPGHGKAVVVAYFLDGKRPRAWIRASLPEAGSPHPCLPPCCWPGAKTFAVVACSGLARGAQRRDRLLHADPAHRLLAPGRGISEHLHEHAHGDDHHHDHHHQHPAQRTPQDGCC